MTAGRAFWIRFCLKKRLTGMHLAYLFSWFLSVSSARRWNVGSSPAEILTPLLFHSSWLIRPGMTGPQPSSLFLPPELSTLCFKLHFPTDI